MRISKRMKKTGKRSAVLIPALTILLLTLCLLCGCAGDSAASDPAGQTEPSAAGDTVTQNTYEQISQEKAKEMMDEQENAVILDVREQDEFDSGHIAGAVLLPVGIIDESTAAEVIPSKDTTVLVYCRSGNRSKTASASLAELGYTQVYEFGGIKTWPYEVEK